MALSQRHNACRNRARTEGFDFSCRVNECSGSRLCSSKPLGGGEILVYPILLARASFLVVTFSLNKDFPMVNCDHLPADSPLFNGKLYQKMLETKCSQYRFWIDARRFNDTHAKNRNVGGKANEDGGLNYADYLRALRKAVDKVNAKFGLGAVGVNCDLFVMHAHPPVARGASYFP